MTFKLSKTSKTRLQGVHPELIQCVEFAIKLTDIDFGVSCGLRTEQQQRELVAKGASQTMHSKHRKQEDGFGHAVDLFAYAGGGARWEYDCYPPIAWAMARASDRIGLVLRWGGAWTSILHAESLMQIMDSTQNYLEICAVEGKRPFIDAPHFEIV